MAKSVADVMRMITDEACEFVDLRFSDTLGKEHHVSMPVSAFGENQFSDGHPFDGSSIVGWKGIEAPVKLAYSARNRSASIRVPHVMSEKARRIEARFPDPMANPYLCFAALLMAGLDGIENHIDPGEAATKDLYHLPSEEDKRVPTVCASLEQALDEPERDRAFLTQGGVFSDAMPDAYIQLKTEEVNRIRIQVNPAEYDMYFSL